MDGRWADLYAEARAPLYRAVAAMIGEAEAEEVVQDAFERAMRSEGFFDDVREPHRWLRRVAVRLAISRMRRRAVWERVRLLIRGDQPPDPNVTWALKRLPSTQRAAVVLRYYFREDYATIASTLGLSESSVAKTLTRARAALRKDLG